MGMRKHLRMQLCYWIGREEMVKPMPLLVLLFDSKIHHIDLEKSSKEIQENLNKLFGAKALDAKFYLKLQLFISYIHYWKASESQCYGR